MIDILAHAIALAALLAVLVPGVACADDTAAMAKFLGDPDLRQAVINSASRTAVVARNPCAGATYRAALTPLVYKPMTFDDAGAPASGALKFPVKQEGCGTERMLNVIVFVQADRKVGTASLLPGTTHADPMLQRDAIRYAVAAAGGPEAGCRVGFVADTRFVDRESVTAPGAKAPAWHEVWTLQTCTKRIEVPVQFIPDATGTTVATGPGTAIRVIPLNTPQEQDISK